MLIAPTTLAIFALACLALVITPGPNMIYLLSRSICQGRRAALISLVGVLVGFLFHIFAASLGLTAILLAVPLAYDAIKLAGAAYLLWMAWSTIRPGAVSMLTPRALPDDPPAKLFRMGLLTNLLNPKVAVFYLSLFPQFVVPEHGHVLLQSLTLGVVQMSVSGLVNFVIVMTASGVATWFSTRPSFQRVQRWVMATVLAGLAARLAVEPKP